LFFLKGKRCSTIISSIHQYTIKNFPNKIGSRANFRSFVIYKAFALLKDKMIYCQFNQAYKNVSQYILLGTRIDFAVSSVSWGKKKKAAKSVKQPEIQNLTVNAARHHDRSNLQSTTGCHLSIKSRSIQKFI